MNKYKSIGSILHMARIGGCSEKFRKYVESGRFSRAELLALYLWDLHKRI